MRANAAPRKIPGWAVAITSVCLAFVGCQLLPGRSLLTPYVLLPLHHETVPIVPYVGTAQWRELGQPEDKLRPRMGLPVFEHHDDGVTYAYPKAYALVRAYLIRHDMLKR